MSDTPSSRKAERALFSALCILIAVSLPRTVNAGYKDESGFTRLQFEMGPAMPSGINVRATHVEGVEAPSTYMPNTNDVEFAGKIFVDRSAISTNVSSHATMVGQRFYGNASSFATNLSVIHVFEVNHWLTNGYLHLENPAMAPAVESNHVQNHSWVSEQAYTNIVRRFDYAIDRDEFLSVVALNNGSGTVIPNLLAGSYNAIVVGRDDGDHSRGTTPIDQPGRVKPDIVAQANLVSTAVPTIASAAALLIDTALANQDLAGARKPECLKAILLAGAAKRKFPTWDRTPARPLDEVYGAGELNIFNSYHILVAGEHDASNTNLAPCPGWDAGSVTATTTSRYFFAVPASNVLADFSAALEWRRHFSNTNPAILTPALANLDLALRASSNYTPGAGIDLSTSVVDNVEYVYRPSLAEGEYVMEVTGNTNDTYALAWFGKLMTRPDISGVELTNDSVRVAVTVSTGHSYIAQASTNLLATNGWTALSTNLVYSTPWYYLDTDSSNHPQRFYRFVPE